MIAPLQEESLTELRPLASMVGLLLQLYWAHTIVQAGAAVTDACDNVKDAVTQQQACATLQQGPMRTRYPFPLSVSLDLRDTSRLRTPWRKS